MTKPRFFLCTCLIFFALSTFLVSAVSAEEDLSDRASDLQEKIEEYEKRLETLKKQETSLRNEIEYANSQIELTQLRIENATAEIAKKTQQIAELAQDIEDLGKRIEKLRESIAYQEKVLGERKRFYYKVEGSTSGGVEFILFLLSPEELSRKIQKQTYSKIMQERDNKLLSEMRATREVFGQQRELFEEKKTEEESLRAQVQAQKASLESYNVELTRAKASKEELLKKTENDESKYQALLAQVRSELAAINFALNLPAGEGTEVKKGDVIGYMGNTGCSTGPHLHFGYIKGGKSVNPLSYLQNGKLSWPVKDWFVTQYFGENYDFYMRHFGVPGHDAIDIISTGQWSGAPIKAAKDGVVYYAKDEEVYCPWINNSLGKGAIIDHGDGERTIYWHLQ